MNFIGISDFDTSNGPGVRVSLFVSGCRVHCKGCFNPESWAFDAGLPFRMEVEGERILNALSNSYVEGFSLLGGDPFEPEHESTLLQLLKEIKNRFPNKTIWAWTGRTYMHVKDSPLLEYVDVLVDGPFVQSRKVDHQWFGSSNQRVLYLKVNK